MGFQPRERQIHRVPTLGSCFRTSCRVVLYLYGDKNRLQLQPDSHNKIKQGQNWMRGFDTPLLNKTLFRRIRYFLGGKVRVMLSGGAPLASDTHSLCRTCLSMPLIQGYGLTETASCATVTHTRDRMTGRAGAPLYDVDIKLVNWEEGNYRVTDKPNPRGEVHLGGDNVAVGYYNNPEETEANF